MMSLPRVSTHFNRICCLWVSIVFIGLTSSLTLGQTYQWQLALSGGFHSVAFNPLSNGRIMFAGPVGYGGIYRSDDAGKTWVQHDSGTSDNPMLDIHQVICLPVDTNIVLAVTTTKLYRSTDGGYSWSDTSSLFGVDGENISYHAADDIVYYGQNYGFATWKSTDHGATWSKKSIDSGYATLCAFDASPDIPTVMLSGSGDSGVLVRSTDEGLTWNNVSISDTEKDGAFPGAEIPKIIFSYYATNGVYNHGIALTTRWLSRTRSILATSDGGSTWYTVNSPSRNAWALDVDQRAAMISQKGDPAYPLPLHFFLGLFGALGDTIPNGLVQETTDGGFTWNSTNFHPVPPDTSHPTVQQIWVLKYDTTSGKVAVATDAGIYIMDTRLSNVQNSSQAEETINIEQYGYQLRIDALGQVISTIDLYDILGRPVYRAAPRQEIYQIITSSFPPGVYMLKANLVNGSSTFKLLTLP